MAVVGTVLQVFPLFDPGSGGIGKRVFWDRVKITCGDQICKVLWRHLLVLGVLIDGGAHVIKILFEDRFIARAFMVGASRHEEKGQYYDRVPQPWIGFHCCIFSELRTRVRQRLAATIVIVEEMADWNL